MSEGTEPRGFPRPRHHAFGYRSREFTRRLVEKCDDDEILFMAGAVAFNLVVALFPLIVLGIGILGFALSRFGDPTQFVLTMVTTNLPQASGVNLPRLVESLTAGLLQVRLGYTIAGAVFLIWVAKRLSGSLRVALREIFDVSVKRNPLHGLLFDVSAVLIGIFLLGLNLGVTVASLAAVELGVTWVGFIGVSLGFAERVVGAGISFGSIWLLLFLMYRYMPSRRTAVDTAFIAATFSATMHELLKFGFSWYATEVANYGSALGNLATVALLFFWIYYEALVFLLGGEVAQVLKMRKASRVGVETFDDRPLQGDVS